MNPPLEQELEKFFGFSTFKKGQKAVIEKIMAGRCAAAIFPTGAGKSLCYQLPALLLPHMTLVVSPLLSLMKDQLDFLLEKNIPAARLDSTLDRAQYMEVMSRAKQGELKILMISVERFKNERFRFHLNQMRISLLVIDEAHCISEWGHNFRPQYLKLPVYRREFNMDRVLLLTATATKAVTRDMIRKFGLEKQDVVSTGFYRKNLFLQVTPTEESVKKARLLKRIQEAPDDPTIVYVTLQKTAQETADFLQAAQIRAHAYHAGMKNEERKIIQDRFMAGDISCVTATIAFGMGIDKKDIRRVIHFDLPKSIENYSQEIGRAGRDGKPAFCEILANLDNVTVLENFVYGDCPEKISIHELLAEIRQTEEPVWEVRLHALAKTLDMRPLPLKTLLVYLEMEGIIRPKHAYYDQYEFKYLAGPEQIADRFKGERRKFVETLFRHCHSKKTWTTAHIPAMVRDYPTQRGRVVAALEYFDEKGWIELSAKQVVEAFDIQNQAFDVHRVADKMHQLFKTKEDHEIRRIAAMIRFFESGPCLSKNLAAYFGETIEAQGCGHCSACKTGKAVLKHTKQQKSLTEYDFTALVREFETARDQEFSAAGLTRFLCGIYTPVFSRTKITQLPQFGVLASYRFSDVKAWVRGHLGQ